MGALTFFGFKSYSDVSELAKNAEHQLKGLIVSAEELQNRGLKLEQTYGVLESQVSRINEIERKQSLLEMKFQGFRASLVTMPDTILEQEIQNSVLSDLEGYFRYLSTLGFQPMNKTLAVTIHKHNPSPWVVKFDVDKQTLKISKSSISSPELIYRAATHHVLGLPTDTWGTPYGAVESALAYYFPLSYLNTPRFAETLTKKDTYFQKRFGDQEGLDLSKSFRLNPTTGEKHQNYPYRWGRVLAGLFWDMRVELGRHKSDKSLHDAWVTSQKGDPQKSLTRFLHALDQKVAQLDHGSHVQFLNQTLKQRGLDSI